MYAKILHRIKNMGFRKKITGISLAISLIPVILLGIFSYGQMRSLMLERESLALRETLRQETDHLNYKLESYLSALNLICWNEGIRTSLSKDYETNVDMYLAYRDVIDPMFLTVRSLNRDITSISVYTDNHMNPHGNVLRPLEEAAGEAWFDQACRSTAPFFQISEDGRSILLLCQFYYKYVPYTNILCMTIDLASALDTADSLFEDNYGFLMASAEGESLFRFTNISGEAAADVPDSGTLTQEGISRDYLVESSALEDTDWRLYLYRPVEEAAAAIRQITYIVLFMILVCILLVSCTSAGLSRLVVHPLEQLSSYIAKVESGNYEFTITSDSTDEVGRLIEAFRKMTANLNHLVNEVLRAKIAQQKYELKILQSQINPHFLYNSLSLINGKAIMAGQQDISQMARLLSTFYRTMLNKGSSITTVESELENTKAYISIQRMMHSDSFDVTYDIAGDVLSFPILNLLLQPLAENAIIHGLDHKETPGKGVLSVSCYREGEDIVFKVMDNGCGMPEEECTRILSADSRGYGVKNVHQRVCLYYGPGYGLSYRSTNGMGTCAVLRVSDSLPPSE